MVTLDTSSFSSGFKTRQPRDSSRSHKEANPWAVSPAWNRGIDWINDLLGEFWEIWPQFLFFDCEHYAKNNYNAKALLTVPKIITSVTEWDQSNSEFGLIFWRIAGKLLEGRGGGLERVGRVFFSSF